jgi:hypothetical protein
MPEKQFTQPAIVIFWKLLPPCREAGYASTPTIIYPPLQSCVGPCLALGFEFPHRPIFLV